MKPAFWLMLWPVLALGSCAKHIYNVAYPTLGDGKYDSEFPYKDCSAQLAEIGESVKMIYCTAFYRTWTFASEAGVTSGVLTEQVLQKSGEPSYSYNSVSGTATVIYYRDHKIALLTCAHILDFPDTLFTYYPPSGGRSPLRSVSIRDRQNNFVKDMPEEGTVEILASDLASDIAIIGQTLQSVPTRPVDVFRYPIGKSKELEWGTYLYIIGYPMGYKMITNGIVSSPNRDKKGSYLTDAPFNRGFSGGVVFAIRDGVPHFELVGMAKSVAANYEFVLTPSKDFDRSSFVPGVPYEGDVFVEQKTDIRYGITMSVSTEAIGQFIRDHRTELLTKGYDLANLFP
jgi:hypothetical protein